MSRAGVNQGFSDAAGWPSLGRAPPAVSGTGPQGHRARMRTRLLDRGPAGLADYEILEMLLFLGIARVDTKPLAKAAILHFGSLAAVLTATPAALLAMPGLTPRCTEAMELVRQAAARLAQAERRPAPHLADWDAVRAHLKRAPFTAEGGAAPHSLFALDGRNRLIEDIPLASIDVPLILRHALTLNASAVLLVTAREDAVPVPADRESLARLRRAMEAVSVDLHDHVLWDGAELFSLTRRQFML